MLRLHRILILMISLVMTTCKHKESPTLVIAAASNTEFVMEELIQEFTKQTGITCQLITGSSGKLSSQIKEKAPYDIFISADMEYPDYLFQLNLTIDKPLHFANGKLVIWTLKDSIPPTIDFLNNKDVKKIAMPNPKHAPYGIAAMQSLKYYKKYEGNMTKKIVWSESISQVNHFIYSGAANIGFTSKSSVLSPKLKNKGVWTEIDPSSHKPIQQVLIILKNTKNRNAARRFKEFIISDNAKEILNKFGYITF